MEAIAGGGMRAQAVPAPVPASRPAPTASAEPKSFAEVAKLFAERREALIYAQLMGDVHPVRFDAEQGRIELRVTERAQADLIGQVSRLLSEWTERRWIVSVSKEEGEPTLAQQRQVAEDNRFAAAASHPLVRAALETFPGARIEGVRELVAPAQPAAEGEDSEGDSER
jgi:DNA polymerase-3 subunit gamma/tau